MAKCLINGEYVDIPQTEPIEAYKPTPQEQIAKLKSQLNADDYKVIKCQEAYLTNRPLPYNIEALAEKRDKIRAEINRLERELKTEVK